MKQVITRAWTDIEPKVYAWIVAGGVLTAVQVIVGYVDPSFPLPIWVAPVVTYLAGLAAAYIKKSVVPVPAATPDHSATDTPTPVVEGVSPTDSIK